jgi:hypothetical protein
MTTFDERERSYEAKFARDEELRFKATARRDKMLGAWAAVQLGLTGPDVETYTQAVVRADFKHPGDADVIAKVLNDFKAKGIPMDERQLRSKMIELMSKAVAQIEAGQ